MSRLNELPEYTDRVLGGLTAGDELKHRILMKALEDPKPSFRASFRAVPAMVCILVLMVAGLGIVGLNRLPSLEQPPILSTSTAGTRKDAADAAPAGKAAVEEDHETYAEEADYAYDAAAGADQAVYAYSNETYAKDAVYAYAEEAAAPEPFAAAAREETYAGEASPAAASVRRANASNALNASYSNASETAEETGAGWVWELSESGDPQIVAWQGNCYVLTIETLDTALLPTDTLTPIGAIQSNDPTLIQEPASQDMLSSFLPEGTPLYEGPEKDTLYLREGETLHMLRKIAWDDLLPWVE